MAREDIVRDMATLKLGRMEGKENEVGTQKILPENFHSRVLK